MKLNFKKSKKPDRVPQLGWTIFIGICGLSGLALSFDSSQGNSRFDQLMQATVGIGFALWALLRAQETRKFQPKLRKKPRLGATIFIFMVGTGGLISSFDSSANSKITDKIITAAVGIGFILWAYFRYTFAKDFEKIEE